MTFSYKKKIGSMIGIISIAVAFCGLLLTLVLLFLLRYYWRDLSTLLIWVANTIILLGLFAVGFGTYAFLKKPRDSLGLIGVFLGFFLAVGLSFGLSVGMYFFSLLGH
jgi:hypothetical protein